MSNPTCDIFLSLRFNSTGPKREAEFVKNELIRLGINAVIIDAELGRSITDSVFNSLEECKMAIIFGNEDYGEDTNSPFSSYSELRYIINERKPFVLIKMCDSFKIPSTKGYLPRDTNCIFWKQNDHIPSGVIEKILAEYRKYASSVSIRSFRALQNVDFASHTLQRVLLDIKNGSIKNVVVLTGAGISTPSGIPDFRSPGGMYQTLQPQKITATPEQREWMTADPTAVVDFHLFSQNQFPYLEVRRPFILGTAEKVWKPTLAHFFIKLLDEKGLLKRLYTQNIDGLDSMIQITPDRLMPVHGTLADIACEFCGSPYPAIDFAYHVKTKVRNIYDDKDPEAPKVSTNIICNYCNAPGVKPMTVMYNRPLPPKVIESLNIDFPSSTDSCDVDLMIIMGTSLTVFPFAQYVQMIPPTVPRLVLNVDPVGQNLGINFDRTDGRDCFLQATCDLGCAYLAQKLNWVDDILVYKSFMCENSQTVLELNS